MSGKIESNEKWSAICIIGCFFAVAFAFVGCVVAAPPGSVNDERAREQAYTACIAQHLPSVDCVKQARDLFP